MYSVDAADTSVLVRSTIRAVNGGVQLPHLLLPEGEAEGVGNGEHVRLSVWNLMSGGDGPCGLTRRRIPES